MNERSEKDQRRLDELCEGDGTLTPEESKEFTDLLVTDKSLGKSIESHRKKKENLMIYPQ